jgi:hypothetical protein
MQFWKFFSGSTRPKAKSFKFIQFVSFWLLAFFIWLLNSAGPSKQREIELKVIVTDVPKHLLLQEPMPTIQLQLNGQVGAWLPIRLKEVEIPYQELRNNKWGVDIQVIRQQLQLDDQLNIGIVRPDSLAFRFVRLKATRLPVHAQIDYSLAPGYALLNLLQLQPDSIWVYSTEALPAEIRQIESKKQQLGPLKTTTQGQLELLLPRHKSIVWFSHQQIDYRLNLAKVINSTFRVAVSRVGLPAHYRLIPDSVDVHFSIPEAAYQQLQPADFVVTAEPTSANQRLFLATKLQSKHPAVLTSYHNPQYIDYIEP